MFARCWLAVAVLVLVVEPSSGADSFVGEPQRFRVETPEVVLTDVPVSKVTIAALRPDGSLDENYEGRPRILGIKWVVEGRETVLPPFRNGVFELTSDLAANRKVYITDSRIVVDVEDARPTVAPTPRILRWFSILPPVLAIVLAVWLRNVIVALFAAVFSGAVLLAHGNVFLAFIRTLDPYLLDQLVGDKSHALIILFTLFLGAMVGVMAVGGGTTALVNSLARFSQTREQGQLLTWFMGLLIFFDDYANTLLVGGTMRPITDRLRISREKLAFLVDSTAAPVAGLAMISTWVGVEVGYIADTYATIYKDSAFQWDGYGTFLATLPYRFYPLLLIAFLLLVGYSGRDFGPMLRAEGRALAYGQVARPDSLIARSPGGELQLAGQARRLLLRNALVPLALLLVLILAGLWWTGRDGLAATNIARQAAGQTFLPTTLWSILQHSDSNRVLFFSSFAASIAAIATAVFSKTLTLRESMEAWMSGARSMFLALLILVFAWAVAMLCDENHLNTAGFLVELTRGRITAAWMPSLAFVLACAVSFATGTSWATMGLLMPLFISMTHYLLVDLGEAHPSHHLMLGTIGAILAGSIFGDHCSPISDTTVLSSAASNCDHLDHVTTQIPYAMAVGVVSLLLGYVPVGFGYSPLMLLPLGLLTLYLLVRFVGRPAAEYARQLPVAEDETRRETDVD